MSLRHMYPIYSSEASLSSNKNCEHIDTLDQSQHDFKNSIVVTVGLTPTFAVIHGEKLPLIHYFENGDFETRLVGFTKSFQHSFRASFKTLSDVLDSAM